MAEQTRPPSTPLPTYEPSLITKQPRGFDLLSLPGLRRLVRWKSARFLFQLPLLILAIFAIWDGLTGRQVAPRNIATTSLWLHYRGLVVIALAIFGNAFCAACPMMLTRGVSKRLERLLPEKFSWPDALRNKYFAIALLLAFFFSYEVFGLWASPWLSAWLAIGYFAGALAVDTLFPAGTFCRYVCPLGQFNFSYATASPTQITALDHDVCRSCEHKPCLHGRDSYSEPPQTTEAAFIPLSEITHPNGEGHFPGCETNLFAPTIQSNMDCTFCFNCVRACPYDNVALTARTPGWEWAQAPWKKRGRLAIMLMGVLLAVWGLLNAVAMIGPYYDVAAGLAQLLGTRSQGLVLGVILLLSTVLGLGAVTLVSVLADTLGGAKSAFSTEGVKTALMRWGYVMLPLGFGFWAAHYLFHLLTGALTIIPVFVHFFWYRGVDITPNWRLAQLIPSAWLFPIGALLVSLYSLLAVYLVMRVAMRDFGRNGALAMWPMLLFVLTFAAFSVWVLGQPMEMRGTIFGPDM